MDTVQIDRKRLNKNIQHISAEEVILILNAGASVRRPEISSPGIHTEKNVAQCIENFEVEKPGNHSGDLIIWKKKYPNIRIMIEIKNYSGPIPTSQLEKFVHDLDLLQFSGGIFITNQPLRAEIISGHIAVVQSYDPLIINSTCELLWNVLFEKQFYKFLDYKNNITPYCDALLENIKLLAKTKKCVEALQKDFNSMADSTVRALTSTIRTINEMTNNIINESSPLVVTQKIKKIVLPDIVNPILPLCRQKLQEIMEKLGSDQILLAHNGNKYEYCFGGKKIALHFFTTKLDIIFEPALLDFTGAPLDLSYSGGLVTIKVTAKNASTDILDYILKFWAEK
jgi:hypothetical protein